MLTWMAYAAGVAGLLAAGGLALERICEALRRPRRFAWLAALTLALVVPLTAKPSPTGDTIGPGSGPASTHGAEASATAIQPAAEVVASGRSRWTTTAVCTCSTPRRDTFGSSTPLENT